MKASHLKFYSVLFLHATVFGFFIVFTNSFDALNLSIKDFLVFGIFSVLYFFLMWFDLYSRPYHHYLRKAFSYIFRNLFICTIALLVFEKLISMVFFERSLSYTFQKDLILVFMYTSVQLLQYFWIIHLTHVGFFRKNVLLVGTYDDRMPVEQLFQNINNSKNFLGQLICSNEQWLFKTDFQSPPQLVAENLSSFLFSHSVNELIICMDDTTSSESVLQCAKWCHENSIGYYLIPNIAQLPRVFPWENKFTSIPSIERFCPNRDSLIMISIKRLIDIIGSACALVILSPVMLIIAILIKLEDGGSIIYTSTRVGIHKKPIHFYKFRSMVPNAEALKDTLLDKNERPDGPLFKLTNDPRVTKLGNFLRTSSLDEIPQFWNVFKGDMSLIGPRPHLPSEVLAYTDKDNLRLECIPGIACLPQIYGRDTIGFREWIDLDLEYRKKWSLLYDFEIIFKTILVVLRIKKES